MLRKISEEVEVKKPISEAWEVYGTIKLANIAKSELAHLYDINILEGDGDVGTVFQITPLAGASSVTAYKEKYTKIDHEKRLKEMEIIEGGYLELGFTFFRITFELIEKEKETSCIVSVTIEYETNEDVVTDADASVVTIKPTMSVIEVVNRYIQQNKT